MIVAIDSESDFRVRIYNKLKIVRYGDFEITKEESRHPYVIMYDLSATIIYALIDKALRAKSKDILVTVRNEYNLFILVQYYYLMDYIHKL